MCAKCYINTKSPKKHFFIKYDVNITHHQSSLIKNFSDAIAQNILVEERKWNLWVKYIVGTDEEKCHQFIL